MRHRCLATLAPWRPAVTPGHLGRSAGLVNEHQPLGLQIGLGVEPGLPAARGAPQLILNQIANYQAALDRLQQANPSDLGGIPSLI